jgi:hypothetical protein
VSPQHLKSLAGGGRCGSEGGVGRAGAALRVRAELREFTGTQERLALAERAVDRAATGRDLGRLQQLRERGNVVPELLDRLEAV